jgi:hypothetical protein
LSKENLIKSKKHSLSENRSKKGRDMKENTDTETRAHESIMEYTEILYSSDSRLKKHTAIGKEKKEASKRTSWENIRTIEQNIDGIDKKRVEISPGIQSNKEMDRKIDRLFHRKK